MLINKTFAFFFVLFTAQCLCAESPVNGTCSGAFWKYNEFCDCCLKLVDGTTYDVAKADCVASGGKSLTIIDDQENEEYFKFANQSGVPNPWIGLKMRNELCDSFFVVCYQWQWSDGNRVYKYANWGPAQPDNQTGDEFCVHFDHSPKWNDFRCDTFGYLICRKEADERT
ncbi:unnamed protein product, partial [Mesorhabditis belari]|uniref:C-type lectin domain-containing protein n=1 Tax=Mesorhabditis belari TaxID=2138241 RepID=A0AAF3EXR9_9BILA